MNKKTYKNLIIIGLAIIAIIAVLFIRSRGNQNLYAGFLKPEEGAWSEIMNGAEDLQKLVYLGEKIIHNIPTYGVEIESIVSGNKSAITQVWRDQKSNEIVEIVSKLEGKNEVICIDDSLMNILIPSFNSLLPAIKTPEKYSPNNEYTYGTFTTVTGKIIQIAKFIDENDMEIWISSKVPFGIVRIVNNETGEIIAFLQDFGLTGGQPKISEGAMLNCKKIDFPNLTK
ncbi:MAG: hypothetical protein KAS91_00265 [Candidatus Pacebacteria bacterium]|nr:hypothetical protein [Candidatus Paceibacterota bacterium]